MKKLLEEHQFSVVLETGFPWPKELSLDFFRNAAIVPDDWEVEGEPTPPQSAGGFRFSNGVGFLARDREFQFVEQVTGKTLDDFFVATVALKYLNALDRSEFSGVRFEIKGHVEVEKVDEARSLVIGRLLADGPWKNSDPKLVDAQMMFAYDFGDSLLALTIQSTVFRLPQEPEKNVVAFFATFAHGVTGDSARERAESAIRLVADWRTDFKRYLDLVNSCFLG